MASDHRELTLHSTWCIMIRFVIPVLPLLLFIQSYLMQSLYSLSKLLLTCIYSLSRLGSPTVSDTAWTGDSVKVDLFFTVEQWSNCSLPFVIPRLLSQDNYDSCPPCKGLILLVLGDSISQWSYASSRVVLCIQVNDEKFRNGI